jgi:drug/metabolite transporter (DMT)-like permease
MKAMLALGAATAVGMILAWKGLARLDPTFASFLWRFFPALTIVSGVLILKEGLSKKEAFAMAIMLLGGVWSVTGRWQTIGSGVTLTILACFAGTAQLLIAKSIIYQVHPNVLVAYRVGIGAALITCWVLATGTANFAVEVRYWYVTLLGAFLGPCASFLLTFRSYRYWTLSQSTMILTAQPLLVLPLAYAFLGTLPAARELVGGSVILAGGFWLAYIHLTKTTRKQSRTKTGGTQQTDVDPNVA